MKLYAFFRWWPYIYKKIYYAYEAYHERRLVYQIGSIIVKWWDKALLIAPIVFILHRYIPNNDLLVAIVDLPGIEVFHQYYLYNSTLFSILSIILFLCSEIFANNLKTIENEKRVSTCFHLVNHRYRDFVDELLVFKKQKDIYSDTKLNGQAEFVYSKYATIIYDMCRKAQRAMTMIINDPECYISIKWLDTTDDRDVFILTHDKVFPSDKPMDHIMQHKLLRSPNGSPKTLFQVIMDRFDNPDSETADTWDWGIRSNDVRGSQDFDRDLSGFNKEIKSTIVLPITINSSLTGFFCFNSKTLGRLREKHQHFLAGYCDNIANLYRSMLACSACSSESQNLSESSQ